MPAIFVAVMFLFTNNAPFHAILVNRMPPSVRASAMALNILVIHSFRVFVFTARCRFIVGLGRGRKGSCYRRPGQHPGDRSYERTSNRVFAGRAGSPFGFGDVLLVGREEAFKLVQGKPYAPVLRVSSRSDNPRNNKPRRQSPS